MMRLIDDLIWREMAGYLCEFFVLEMEKAYLKSPSDHHPFVGDVVLCCGDAILCCGDAILCCGDELFVYIIKAGSCLR